MEPRVLDLLRCPLCGSDLLLPDSDRSEVVEDGSLSCLEGHVFPVADGVPRLIPGSAVPTADAAKSIHESFSREWEAFEYEDRTWGATVEQRRDEFLRHVNLPADALRGKLVLDAGCGNGSLSRAISGLGCEVVAGDISDQAVQAHRHFRDRPSGETHYLQVDLMHPPFRPGRFDVVFCAGVLHHTPDTRETFERIIPAVSPGGTIFVWLYHHVPGRLLAVKSFLRRCLSRLPAGMKSGVVLFAVLPQAMVRQRIRTLRDTGDPRENLSWRERYVILLDSYTPRYRWEHTPEELAGWYREHGFADITVTERGKWGFGVAARRPATGQSAAPSS